MLKPDDCLLHLHVQLCQLHFKLTKVRLLENQVTGFWEKKTIASNKHGAPYGRRPPNAKQALSNASLTDTSLSKPYIHIKVYVIPGVRVLGLLISLGSMKPVLVGNVLPQGLKAVFSRQIHHILAWQLPGGTSIIKQQSLSLGVSNSQGLEYRPEPCGSK